MDFQIELKQEANDASNADTLHRFITMRASEKDLSLKIQLPAGFNGPTSEKGFEIQYTPEELYLASLSGCFFTTFNVVSKNSKLSYVSIEIASKGTMEIINEEKMMTHIQQDIKLLVPASTSGPFAQKILEIAEKRCPLANSVKTIIQNTYTINFIQ